MTAEMVSLTICQSTRRLRSRLGRPVALAWKEKQVKVTSISKLHETSIEDNETLNEGTDGSRGEEVSDLHVDLPIAGETDLEREAGAHVEHPGFTVTAGTALRGSSFFKDQSEAKLAAAQSALSAAIDANEAKRSARVKEYVALNDVSVRRLQAVYADALFSVYGSDPDEQYNYALALAADALSLGYALSRDAVDALTGVAPWAMKAVLSALQSTRGADWDYKPMYPDFPKQVEDATARELITNALAHYTGDLFGLRVMPDYKPSPRLPLSQSIEFEKLGVASAGDLAGVALKLLSAGQVLSDQDKDDLKTLLGDSGIRSLVEDSAELEETTTKIRENFVWVAGEFDGALHSWAISQFSLPTDALRYAAKLSGGDESLAELTKFHLSRAQRREVASALNHAVDAMSDRDLDLSDQFARHAEEWKQVARILHPHELASKGRLSREAEKWLSKTMNGAVRSFDSRVEEAFSELSYSDDEPLRVLLALLSKRPGSFARRIVELYRKTGASQHGVILDAFRAVAGDVSTPVLVQLWNLMQFPADETAGVPETRVIVVKTPKGAKTDVVENRVMRDVSEQEAKQIISVIEAALIGRKDDLYVELGEHSTEYAVPLGTRSASKGTRIAARGSRIKVEGYDKASSVIRLFMHWHDLPGDEYRDRVDLDLSAVAVTADFTKADKCWYGLLRTGSNTIMHSGDITSAPDGAAEFIDAKAADLLAKGYRYVAMSVYSYSRQTFDKVPEAAAGLMLRGKLGREGEIFDARTVKQKFDLTHECTNATPFMFDLETGEIIWLDLDVSMSSWNSVGDAANSSLTIQAMKTAAWGNPMTVAELAALEATLVCRETIHGGVDKFVDVNGETVDGSKVIKIEGWDSENTMQLL